MIAGAHVVLYSRHPGADRRFVRDVLGFPSVDAGEGWLIFALPPSELPVHPGEESDGRELYLTCDDLAETVRVLRKRKIKVSQPREEAGGTVARITLPGGSERGLYQPSHPSPTR